MAFSYKGSITFGLVYVPITLHTAAKSRDIGFNMLDKKTMSRVRYKKTCVGCEGREVEQTDLVRGYEYEKDKYVVFTDEDFEKIKTKRDKNVTIERFVDLDEIDPVYYDRTYYVNPQGAENAFALLVSAMEQENKVGIAKAVIGTKETLIALRSSGGRLTLHTLFFADEIQKNPTTEQNRDLNPKELAVAKTIIESMSDKFEPSEYHDEYRERVISAIERKISGKEIVKAREKNEKPITDLMEALQASLKSISKQSLDARKSAAQSAPTKRAPSRRTAAKSSNKSAVANEPKKVAKGRRS